MEFAKMGICDLCFQELVLSENDCWHPFDVPEACPPELPDHNGVIRPSFGDGPGRPGREHWIDVFICL